MIKPRLFFTVVLFVSMIQCMSQSIVSRTVQVIYPQGVSSIALYPSNTPIAMQVNPVGEAGMSSLPVNTVLAQTTTLTLNYDIRSNGGSSHTITANLSPDFPTDIFKASLVLVDNNPSSSGLIPTVPNALVLSNIPQVWASDISGLYSGIGMGYGLEFRIEIERDPNGDYSNTAAGDYNATVEFNITP